MGAVEIVIWGGLEPQKDLRGMLVSLVLCQRLLASFLGWVISVGSTPSYFTDAQRASGATSLCLDHCVCI